MSKRKNPKKAERRKPLHDEITGTLIAELERGTPPWIQPWRSAPLRLPGNVVSGKPYSGMNVLALWSAMCRDKFESPWWLTFQQARGLGGSVRRGEHGTKLMFWSRRSVSETDERGREVTREAIVAREFTVFNVEQTDGLELPQWAQVAELPARKAHGRDERIDAWIAATTARVETAGTARSTSLQQTAS
jgi:antirestriction protein ArdC